MPGPLTGLANPLGSTRHCSIAGLGLAKWPVDGEFYGQIAAAATTIIIALSFRSRNRHSRLGSVADDVGESWFLEIEA